MTLYKLMILDMLRQVNFPLTNTQITDFFLTHEYTNYFTVQKAVNELLESRLISMESIHNTSRYSITEEGQNTLGFFGKKIPSLIKNDIDSFLRDNKFKMRNEVGNTADYYKNTNQEYVVHCEVREGKTVLIGLDLTVPDEKEAAHMCERWKDQSTVIYSNIMKSLMSDSSDDQ